MAAGVTLGSFGDKLREARERRGVSLRQIANATKISISVLEALERNDISRLPGGIFGRAFVRSYAIEVGLDPDDIIQEFIARFPHDSVTAGHPAAEPLDDHEEIEGSRRMANTFLRLALMSVPIAGIVVYLGMAGGRATEVARQQTQAPAAAIELAAAPSGPPAPAPTPAPEVDRAAADRLRVALSASRSCWLSATVDGKKVIERMLQAGERQTFDVQRELVLTAGDAAAITMMLNGEEAKPLGKTGEVVTTRLGPANFRKHLVAE
jgi:cytoskeleton protein RodZ